MPPEKLVEAREWFSRAQEDIEAAECLLHRDPPLIRTSLFHAQQAVEKSLKGFLVWHEQPFRKIHDLRELSGQILQIEPSLESALKQAVLLDPFAIVFRYPGDTGEPSLGEAKESLDIARSMITVIAKLLPVDLFSRTSR